MSKRFTPETSGAVIQRIAAGLTLADTATALDIRLPTLKSWIGRGNREESGLYHDFAVAVDEAREAFKNRPEPMDEEELLQVVSIAARKGSVAAMKLRWEMILDDRKPPEPPDTSSPEAFFAQVENYANTAHTPA